MGKQTSHLTEGTILSGRYRIVKFIGSGGFGCTYLADHLLFNTKVAIKEFFVSSLCNRDNTGVVSIGTESQTTVVEKLADKFLREARNLNKLSHPNIVRVSDVFVENGTNYYVMDYIEGRSLHDAMYSDGPLSEPRMMKYMGQIMDALEYLHGRNMLHLDIKPDNIMITPADKAVLIDFGVAKQYGDGSNDGNSTVMGQTPGFAPLEQMSNNVKSFSAATDIYALGATMYALITGVTPPTAPELASGVAELQPLPPYVSDNLRHTLAAMMKIRSADRLQSISEVRDMLAGKQLAVPAPTPTVLITDEPDNIPLQPAAPAKANRGKKKGLILGLIAAAVITVGLGVFAFLQFSDFGKDKKGEDTAITSTQDDNNPKDDGSTPYEEEETTPPTTETGEKPAPSKDASDNQGSAAAPKPSTGTSTTPAETESPAAAPAPVQITTGTPGQNGHSYVDMGNGMYWATCNIGASSPQDNGSYFAWGEVSEKSTFSKGNYALADMSLPINISGSQYDAASNLWGMNWHTPTTNDWNKLFENCTWEAKDNGVLLTAKNGNTLFLPIAGFKNGSSKMFPSYYWASQSNGEKATIIAISDANGKALNSRTNGYNNFSGHFGMPIRPIYKQ